MDKVSGYIVANGQGGYDVIEKILPISTKPFTIPISEFTDEKQTTTIKTKDYTLVDYDPFKASSIELPGYIHTKTEPARSDEEILKELEELAKEHARTGQSSNDDKRFLELRDEFISSVSPDREGILNRSVNEIFERLYQGENYSMDAAFQQIDSQRKHKKEEDEKEPIDYFIEALRNKEKGSSGATSSITRNGNYHTETIDHGGGMITYLHYANGKFSSMTMQGNNYYVGGIDNNSGAVTYADFFDDSGEKIMCYDDNNGLWQLPTKAEQLRIKELFFAYNAAYDVATGKQSENDKSYSWQNSDVSSIGLWLW